MASSDARRRSSVLPDLDPGPAFASARLGVAERDLKSPSLIMLVVICTGGVVLYALFLLNPANAGDPLLYWTVIVCEGFIIFQALLSMWTALSAPHDPRSYQFYEAQRQLFYPTDRDVDEELFELSLLGGGTDQHHGAPGAAWMQLDGSRSTVDVYVTTYGEDIAIIERTVRAARDMRGRHETYVLDDGHSPEVAALARELGVHYVERPDNRGAKAGNINHALSVTDGQFFVILDADFVPSPQLLVETLPFFVEDDVAFVQTPQAYSNISNFISRGAGFMQAVFYSLAMPGKNRFNSAFCVGTNVVFRRSAVEQIGGMYQESKSEDIWTSLRLHEHGWRSVYIPMILAVGATPENIEAYTKQQLRWATGAFEIFWTHNPLFARKLSVDQRLQYFGTSTFYFNGLVTFVLLLMPSMQIFLNLTPVNQSTQFWVWMLFYLGFYGLQVMMAGVAMGSFRWEVLLLSTASFSIYTKAFWNVLRGKDTAWHVTGRTGRANSPFHYIIPQALMFVFLLLTSVAGLFKWSWTGEVSVALIWNALNTVAFGLFVGLAFAEARQLRRPAAAAPPAGTATAVRPAAPVRTASAPEAAPAPPAPAETLVGARGPRPGRHSQNV